MILTLADRVTTQLIANPFTETDIPRALGSVWRPGIIVTDDTDGTWTQGLHRLTGYVFTYDVLASAALFDITVGIDLHHYYKDANAVSRKLTLGDVVFLGDTVGAEFLTANFSTGQGVFGRTRVRDQDTRVVGIPFRAQMTSGTKVSDTITDAAV